MTLGYPVSTIANLVNLFAQQVTEIVFHNAIFIHPAVVAKVIARNKADYSNFCKLFYRKNKSIKIEHFLISPSEKDDYACVFPGVVRGPHPRGYNPVYKAIVDDNMRPRELWSYLFFGCGFNNQKWGKSVLNEFELAHIFSHKHDWRYDMLEAVFWPPVNQSLFPKRPSASGTSGAVYTSFGAEYTGVANVILLPKGMGNLLEIHDVAAAIFRRALDLYTPVGLRISGRDDISTFITTMVPSWYSALPPVRLFPALPFGSNGNSGSGNNSVNSTGGDKTSQWRKIYEIEGDLFPVSKDWEKNLNRLFEKRNSWITQQLKE